MSKIGNKIRSQDQFGESFHMKLKDGEDVVQTWMGSFCSIFLMAVIILYTIQKVDVLMEKKDVDILTSLNDSYLDSNFIFSNK